MALIRSDMWPLILRLTDADFAAPNIKYGVNILGVSGSYHTYIVENKIINGNFIVTNGWNLYNVTTSASNNVLSVTGNGGSRWPFVKQISVPVSASHQMYTSITARVTNSVCQLLYNELDGSTAGTVQTVTQNTPTQNQWYTFSSVRTQQSDFSGSLVLNIGAQYADVATANGKVMEVKDVICVDLTEEFGAGNEPSASTFSSWLASGYVLCK